MRLGGSILLAASMILTACSGAPTTGAEDSQTASVQSPLEATGQVTFYGSVKGVKQGAFAGESTNRTYLGQIPAFRFSMGMSSPTDPATGMASGKNVLEDVTLTKAFGASDPQFLAAASTGELLQVVFTFVKIAPDGSSSTWQTVTLTNATVDKIERSTLELDDTAKTSMLADQISLRFQKLTLTDTQTGKTSTITH